MKNVSFILREKRNGLFWPTQEFICFLSYFVFYYFKAVAPLLKMKFPVCRDAPGVTLVGEAELSLQKPHGTRLEDSWISLGLVQKYSAPPEPASPVGLINSPSEKAGGWHRRRMRQQSGVCVCVSVYVWVCMCVCACVLFVSVLFQERWHLTSDLMCGKGIYFDKLLHDIS